MITGDHARPPWPQLYNSQRAGPRGTLTARAVRHVWGTSSGRAAGRRGDQARVVRDRTHRPVHLLITGWREAARTAAARRDQPDLLGNAPHMAQTRCEKYDDGISMSYAVMSIERVMSYIEHNLLVSS